jgi:hypothetical protein
MNKKYFILFAIAGLCATLFMPAGCDDGIRSPLDINDSPLPALTVGYDTLDVSSTANTYPISVTCEAEWIAYNDTYLFPWLTVSSGNVAGNGTFNVVTEDLPLDLAERTAPVTIRLAGSTRMYKEVVVRQKEEEPVLTVTGIPALVNQSGETFPVEIESNAQWIAGAPSNINWLHITPDAGLRDNPATITVDPNPTGHAQRLAVLTFRAGIGRKPFPYTIRQDGDPVTLSVTSNFPGAGQDIPGMGASYAVNITTNAVWSIASSQEWFSFNPASGDGNGVVTVTVGANGPTATRAGTVTVTAFDLTQTIGVTQAIREAYVLHGGALWGLYNLKEKGEFVEDPNDVGHNFFEDRIGNGAKPGDNGFIQADYDADNASILTYCPTGWHLPSKAEYEAAKAGGTAYNRTNANDSDHAILTDANGHTLDLPFNTNPDEYVKGGNKGGLYLGDRQNDFLGWGYFGWWTEAGYQPGMNSYHEAWQRYVRCVKDN